MEPSRRHLRIRAIRVIRGKESTKSKLEHPKSYFTNSAPNPWITRILDDPTVGTQRIGKPRRKKLEDGRLFSFAIRVDNDGDLSKARLGYALSKSVLIFMEYVMQTIREIVHPKKSTIRIRIPESFINKDIEVIACPVEKESSDAYIFTDLAGRLKWTGDAVKEQRRLRDEW